MGNEGRREGRKRDGRKEGKVGRNELVRE